MKKFTAILAILALSILSASAQKMLWTWKANNNTRQRVVESVSMNKDGSGAFLLIEIEPLQNYYVSRLLVWLDPKGDVILSERHEIEDSRRWDYSSRWRVSFRDKDTLVVFRDVFENEQASYYKAGANKVVLTGTIEPRPSQYFDHDTFTGWLESTVSGKLNRPFHSALHNGSGGAELYSTDSISAWKF